MVARRSRGSWRDAAGAAAQARALQERLKPLVEENPDLWQEALEALRDPGEELADKVARAAEIPLLIAELAADVASLAALTAELGDGTYRSDAAVAAVLAEAGARAAEALVAVNLVIPRDDERRLAAHAHTEAARAAAQRALQAGP